MIVLDASVVLYATADHPLRERARAAIETKFVCVPDIFSGEVANALARMVRTRRMEADTALTIFRTVQAVVDEEVRTGPLVPSALEWALKINHGVFDLLYVELARLRSCIFLTADSVLVSKVAGTPLEGTIRDVAHWAL